MTEAQSNSSTENLQTIDDLFAERERDPAFKLMRIRGGLTNVAALLHVAYKSASFEADDYQDEIFNKSIGNGGDAALIEKILDQVKILNDQLIDLNSQLSGDKE